MASTWQKSRVLGREWIRLRRKHPRRATKSAFALYRQILSSPPRERSSTVKLLALAVLYSAGTLYGNTVGLWKYRALPDPESGKEGTI